MRCYLTWRFLLISWPTVKIKTYYNRKNLQSFCWLLRVFIIVCVCARTRAHGCVWQCGRYRWWARHSAACSLSSVNRCCKWTCQRHNGWCAAKRLSTSLHNYDYCALDDSEDALYLSKLFNTLIFNTNIIIDLPGSTNPISLIYMPPET